MEFGGHVVQPVSQSTWLRADDWRLRLSRLESCKLLGLETAQSLWRGYGLLIAMAELHYRATWLKVNLPKGKQSLPTEMCNWNLLPQIVLFASDLGLQAILECIMLCCVMSKFARWWELLCLWEVRFEVLFLWKSGRYFAEQRNLLCVLYY